jgi:hypothetical protein
VTDAARASVTVVVAVGLLPVVSDVIFTNDLLEAEFEKRQQALRDGRDPGLPPGRR